MGEGIMDKPNFKLQYKNWSIKFFQEFEALAYKAIFERGYVDVDFNKQHWNIHLKNLLSLNTNVVRLLFDGEVLVGFYILQFHVLPWNQRTYSLLSLLHLAPGFRSVGIYESMFRDAEAIAKLNNAAAIQALDQSILMQESERRTLFHNTGFNLADNIWEKQDNDKIDG